MGKTKKLEKRFSLRKWDNKGFTNRGRFQGLQIGARRITKRSSFGDFKSRRKDYKSGQGLQIRAEQLLCHKTLLYYKDSFIPDRLLQEKYNQKVDFLLGNSLVLFQFPNFFLLLLFLFLVLSSTLNNISEIIFPQFVRLQF